MEPAPSIENCSLNRNVVGERSTGRRPARHDVEINHAQYLGERHYRRLVHAQLRRLAGRGTVPSFGLIVHEPNKSCCRRQPWPSTLRRIVQALTDDGLRTAALLIGSGDRQEAS